MIIVGVDAGGSKTRAVAWRDGLAMGQALGGPGAVRPGRALGAAAVMSELARKALASAGVLRADVLVVGAAGVGREAERRELVQSLRNEQVASRVRVVTDVALAHAAAFGDGPGLVLSAGTGSIAIGRDIDGKVIRQGGYGWQISDEGSGYAVARSALEAVTRAHDGRGPKTVLSELLPGSVRAASFDDLVRWATTATVGEVASLASDVLAAANSGDEVARAIMAESAERLVGLALRAAELIEAPRPVPVAMAGSLIGPGSPLRERVAARLASCTILAVEQLPVDPLDGALLLARDAT